VRIRRLHKKCSAIPSKPPPVAHAIRIEWRRFRCHSEDDGFCLPVNVDKPALNAEGHQHPATAVDEIPLAAVIAFRKSRPSGRPSFVLVDFLLGALPVPAYSGRRSLFSEP
jgi:hypothetical protein